MKIFVLVILLVIVGGAMYWFYVQPKEESLEVTSSEELAETTDERISVASMETGTYVADKNESTISWQAGKPAISGYVHNGNFKLDSGSINLTDEDLTGEFVIDVNSLKVTSLGGGKAGQESVLEGHLKGQGFFNTAEFPTATFKIVGISPKVLPGPGNTNYTASGELTMKGVTNSLEFPARVIVEEDGDVWLFAEFDLDRTTWGISMGSAKIVERITDQIIGDAVNLSLAIKLTK